MMAKTLTPENFTLLLLEAYGGNISGKTLFQKRAYFFSVLMKKDMDFKPHYFGPYSPEVDGGLSYNKALGFIEEQTHGYGRFDTVGFEVRRYDYCLTSDGKEIVEDIKQSNQAEWKRIQSCIKRMKTAGDNGDYVMLSIAAKTFYILKKLNMPMTNDEISDKAKSLGWDIKPPMINKAVSFLENLSLVKRN